MHTDVKINLTRYFLLSSILIAISYSLARSKTEMAVMSSVFIAACLNQWMLVNIVREATQNAATNAPVDKGNIVIMAISKILVLIIALTFGVHIMGNRIIIPVIIYVLQIAVLYLSFEKQTGAEKGS